MENLQREPRRTVMSAESNETFYEGRGMMTTNPKFRYDPFTLLLPICMYSRTQTCIPRSHMNKNAHKHAYANTIDVCALRGKCRYTKSLGIGLPG